MARAVAIMAMTAALGTTVSAAPVAGPAAGPVAGPGTGATVNIDGADPGPAFQGIGAISGGGGNSRLHVWTTRLRGPAQFIRRGDIVPDQGAFTALLRPGYVYTFTTTTGQSRAGGRTPPIPVAGPMPIQYTATADGAGMAKMLAPVDGSFGYVHGVLTQTAAGEPVEWKYPGRSPRPLRDRRREHLARLHGLGPRCPPGVRERIPATRRHADRAVPGVPEVRHQPVPGLRTEGPR